MSPAGRGTDPTARYVARLPDRRPPGLRLVTHVHTWYRLDREPPQRWQWAAFPTPRYRFDSATGRYRTRYAGDGERVMMRESFDATGRVVSPPDLERHLVALSGRLRVLDLRRESVLDALGLDDQISTGRAPGVWVACQRLADLVHDWFGTRCDGIVYRSRTTPQRSTNLAFFAHSPLQTRNEGRLGGKHGLLAACINSDGFTVEGW